MTDTPAWARGFDLAFLKECAAALRPDIKPHCYGAFGLPKERDVADAHAEGGLLWTKEEGRIAAVAIFRVLSSGSQHSDFADRSISIQARELLIRHLGGSAAGKAKLIEHLIRVSPSPIIWAEAHVENRETVELLERAGFAWVMTKIAASSDLKGLYARQLPAGRFPQALDPADRPALEIVDPAFITEAEQRAILGEAEAYAASHEGAWAQHYSGYNKRRSWTSFALQGFDPADPGFIIKPAEMSKKWKAENPNRLKAACLPTIAAEHFPAAIAIADRVPGRKQRVRLMRLSARGGELTRHSDITDPEAGTQDRQIARMHIPLFSPAECMFRGWALDGSEHRRHFPERSLCYLDTRKPHAVINPGEADRIHLVIDTYSGPELRSLIAASAPAG